MNKTFKRLISVVLAVVLVLSCVPATAIAAARGSDTEGYAELEDGFMSVSVSKENGGFLVDTLLGNQLKQSDDNKELLFPSAGYDSSFTSFQITRTDGSTEEYVFGRKYGFLGLSSSEVIVEHKGNSIVSTWSVKDLTFTQTLSLVDQTNPQHGLVDISYKADTTADDVENIKIRIMLDSALGSQDYAYYQLHSKEGGYDLVQKEAVIPDPYDNILLSVSSDNSSPVRAYTVNAIVEGEELRPYQVAFGHWANMANTVFGFVPDPTRPTFNSPYDGKYLTADSAYALYFDMGQATPEQGVSVSTYYGVYSNVTVSSNESVAINFTQLPSPMVVKEDSTLENASYLSQVEGGKDGDVVLQMSIENVGMQVLQNLVVQVKTMNNVYIYTGDYPQIQTTVEGDHRFVLNNLSPEGATSVQLNFNVKPLNISEYRYFEIEVYKNGVVSEGNLIGSNGFYLLCPSVLGEEVSFNTSNPQVIYTEGSRTLHVSGENFRLLSDTSAYTAYLRPVEEETGNPAATKNAPAEKGSSKTQDLQNRGSALIPGTNISVNQGENTMNLIVDGELAPGVYELVLDWVDESKGETVSKMLVVEVSDDPAYKTPTYGIVTVERDVDYSRENPTYIVGAYKSEAEYRQAWENQPNRNIFEDVLLEFRGDFTMALEQTTDEDTGEVTEVMSLTAQSIKHPNGSITGNINISDCLEVEGGYVTLRIENPGQEDQCIYTDIDGHVFTAGERTTVWDGVCAITPIANGDVNQLVQYYENGQVDDSIENTTALANTIGLLWPSAAGTMQTICGMFFELRYCEFGTIAAEYCDKNIPIPDNVDRIRVIAFSAILDPSFLLPTDFDWSGRETTALDVAQRTLAKKNYTSEQLIEVDRKFKADQKKWEEAQEGSLVLIVDNIFFGDSRFIGFDAQMDVGLPSYFEGIGGIEGSLSLVIWMLDPSSTVYTEFGVAGVLDLEMFLVEATLVLKSLNGIPIPDELYLYVGGFTPGWNLDGVGVLWLTGVGGGFSNLYDSIMSKSKVPAFSVSLEGGFSLFQILFARIKLTLSARGFSTLITGLGYNRSYSSTDNIPGSGMHGSADILTIIPSMGFSVYWYPKFQASAHLEVSILNIIVGGGYLVLEEDTERDRLFFEALASCTVQTPKIPLIGSIKLGGIDVGIDTERVYGVLHVLKLDMGVCYYYGGDVDFSFGKYDVPGPTLCSMPVGRLNNGDEVYLAFGTNITEVASSQPEAGVVFLSNTVPQDGEEPYITSASDRMHHGLHLGAYAQGDRAVTIRFAADDLAEARRIAMGDMFTDGLELVNEKGESYSLSWLDTTAEIIDPETADQANALLSYDAETGMAEVTVSFTREEDFLTDWQLNSSAACEVIMYSLNRLADIDSVSFEEAGLNLRWSGSKLEDLDEMTVTAMAEDGGIYTLFETTDTQQIQSGSVKLKAPEALPTGSYTIQLVAKDHEGNVNDLEQAETKWNYINPRQPAAPKLSNLRLGGDYTMDLDLTAQGSVAYDGYAALIYQWDESLQDWVEADFAEQSFEADAKQVTLGGSYDSVIYFDENGKELSYAEARENPDLVARTETVKIGLEADTRYRIGVCAYVLTENGEILYSEQVYSQELTMKAPDPATVTVTAQDSRLLEEINGMGETVTRDVFTNTSPTVTLQANQNASVVWTLDGGLERGQLELTADTPVTLQLTGGTASPDAASPEGLSQGEHTLTLHTTNAQGDESSEIYTFRVDSEAPKLMISDPQTGTYFGHSVTVNGISEPGALLDILVDGEPYATITVPETTSVEGELVEGGNFSVDVALDTSVYEHCISLSARDAAGNTSRSFELILINDIAKTPGRELAMFLDGEDITGQVIPAEAAQGQLELRYVLRNADGLVSRSVSIPRSSRQGAQVYWESYVVAGSTNIDRDSLQLKSSTDVNAMVVATLDRVQVSAVLGGNAKHSVSTYTVTLPADPVGYSIETEDSTRVGYNGSFTFRVEVLEGYDARNLKVFANSREIPGQDGVFEIRNICADIVVTVTGIEDLQAPTVEIRQGSKFWNSFLHVITFGIFFNETAKVEILAEDKGSGLAELSYYISESALTEEAVKALTDWTVYDDPLSLEDDGTYVVYARAKDRVGNTVYVSSDGMVMDTVVPGIAGIVDGGLYYDSVTFTVSDSYMDTVEINGVLYYVAPDGSSMGSVEITLEPSIEPYVIVARDKAGNETSITIEVSRIFQIILPEEMQGYEIIASAETVPLGGSYSFTVEVAEGYDASVLEVTVNGVPVEADATGLYEIFLVDADQRIEVTGVEDRAAPAVQIQVEESTWSQILEFITFGIFYPRTETATLSAEDTGSGLYGLYYMVAADPVALETLGEAGWTAYTEPVKLETDGNYIVYAKAVDQAGNISYANSDGLVIDTVAPSAEGIEDGAEYVGEVTFTVKDANLESVEINGVPVSGELFTLKPAEGQQSIRMRDKAGNETLLYVTVHPAPDPGCNGGEGCPSGGYEDLDPAQWYHEDVDYVIENGLMEGFGDGSFRPDEKLSRAMLVQVLYNMEGRPEILNGPHFDDVDPEGWYADAIAWAGSQGIVQGYGDGCFGPDDPVTREQMATIFYRYSVIKGYSLTEGSYAHFDDAALVSEYARQAMAWAVGNGLLIGNEENLLSPGGETDRAQFAAVVHRFCEGLT